VGGATERSLSPAPAVEEVVPEPAQQATGAGEPQKEERRPESSTTTGTMEPVVAQAEEEAPAEAGLIDIASILGALTVTVVRSSL
jgi:predicted secreted protein